MTRGEAKWVLELVRDRYSSVDVDRYSLTDAETDAINMAIEALEAWDEVIHSLNCLDRLEYTDCDKPFNVYPKSNVDAIINKYMKEVEDDENRSIGNTRP